MDRVYVALMMVGGQVLKICGWAKYEVTQFVTSTRQLSHAVIKKTNYDDGNVNN